MAENKGPWDDNDEGPWQGESNSEKVLKFRKPKTGGSGLKLDAGPKLIIAGVLALWLASGFIRYRPTNRASCCASANMSTPPSRDCTIICPSRSKRWKKSA